MRTQNSTSGARAGGSGKRSVVGMRDERKRCEETEREQKRGASMFARRSTRGVCDSGRSLAVHLEMAFSGSGGAKQPGGSAEGKGYPPALWDLMALGRSRQGW